MKKLILVVAALGLLAAGGPALAASTNTMSVSAAVTGTCKFNSGASTLSFGTLDQTSSSDATATSSTTFWCTKGATYTITNDNGLHYSAPNLRMINGSDSTFVPYSISYTGTGSGLGKTTPVTLSVAGTIVNANYVDATAGSYSDTVVLSVTP